MHGVRDGYLYQTIDYNEYDIDMPISKNKLALMKEYFPNLLHTPFTQGVLLSKKSFAQNELDNDKSLGKILGFPCEFDDILTVDGFTEPRSFVHINVSLQDSCRPISIISFICLESGTTSGKIDTLVNKIKAAFKKDSTLNALITSVESVIEYDYNEDVLIQMLINNETLDKEQKAALDNKFFNMAFSEDFRAYMEKNLQYTNPLHRGIAIGILTASKYPLLEPFFPLQNNSPEQHAQVDDQTLRWEQYLMETLEQSRA